MGGAVNVVLLHQENAMNKSSKLHKRLVHLENNEVCLAALLLPGCINLSLVSYQLHMPRLTVHQAIVG